MRKKNSVFGLFGLFVVLFFVINGCDITTDNNNGNNNGTGNNDDNTGSNGNGGNNNGNSGNNGNNENGTPIAADYNIGNLNQTAGSVTAVIITAKSGKSTGTRTIYYDGNTVIPQAQGEYTVTFDVAAATGWNAVAGLFAGTLIVNSGNSDRTIGFLELAKMDIEDAHTVYIAPGPVTSTNEIYTINDAGNVKEMTYTYKDEEDNTVTKDGQGNIVIKDKDGNDITDEIKGDVVIPTRRIPTAVYNAGINYIIVCYSSEGYLVRKNDGAVFSLAGVGLPQAEGVANDNQGNIYYRTPVGSQMSVVRIDVQTPSSLTRTVYSPSTDWITSWDITPDGHLIYAYQPNRDWRIRKANGGLYNPIGYSNYGSVFWIGLDGKIRYNGGGKLHTVTIDQNYNVIEQSLVLNFDSGYPTFCLRFTNRILFVRTGSWWGEILEFENPDNLPRSIDFSSIINTIRIAENSNSFYYLLGKNNANSSVLLKINPETDAVTTLLQDQYDIYKMTVSPNDVVTFNALRMSDGAIVIGEISAAGQVKILDATLTNEVVVLERIR